MWRPKDWKKTHRAYIGMICGMTSGSIAPENIGFIFEAGADEILKVLISQGIYLKMPQGFYYSDVTIKAYTEEICQASRGYLVFIPDKEANHESP